MRILLVHRNFPGQFRNLAPALVKAGHKVSALTWTGNANSTKIPTAKYEHDMKFPGGLSGFYQDYSALGANAARVARDSAIIGFSPDVVLGSINWGETLFLKEVWPKAHHIGYAEFYYATKGTDNGFDTEFNTPDFNKNLRTLARNAHLLMGASNADTLIAPTHWQASTFPADVQGKMHVIHDGIATNTATPKDDASYQVKDGPLLTRQDEVLTFVNRNLEPYRGYHILMRALPALMAERPNLQIVMVGGDGKGYGGAHSSGTSWKELILNEVRDRIDLNRLHFVGRVPYPQLLNILRIGRAHVYMTYPFVLSWSMLEAMSLGCVVIGSNTAPVAEMIEDGVTGHLVDFFDQQGWVDKILHCLEDPDAQAGIRSAARQHIVQNYDFDTVCFPQLHKLITRSA